MRPLSRFRASCSRLRNEKAHKVGLLSAARIKDGNAVPSTEVGANISAN